MPTAPRTSMAQAAELNVELVTKMPSAPKDRLAPEQFHVSEDGDHARCPAGIDSTRVDKNKDCKVHKWDPAACQACELKQACRRASSRSLQVAPDFHERRKREHYARSEQGRRQLRQRVAVEHAIARLKNLGAGTARYLGRAKTLAQWLWTAAVSNLSLVWAKQAAVTA